MKLKLALLIILALPIIAISQPNQLELVTDNAVNRPFVYNPKSFVRIKDTVFFLGQNGGSFDYKLFKNRTNSDARQIPLSIGTRTIQSNLVSEFPDSAAFFFMTSRVSGSGTVWELFGYKDKLELNSRVVQDTVANPPLGKIQKLDSLSFKGAIFSWKKDLINAKTYTYLYRFVPSNLLPTWTDTIYYEAPTFIEATQLIAPNNASSVYQATTRRKRPRDSIELVELNYRESNGVADPLYPWICKSCPSGVNGINVYFSKFFYTSQNNLYFSQADPFTQSNLNRPKIILRAGINTDTIGVIANDSILFFRTITGEFWKLNASIAESESKNGMTRINGPIFPRNITSIDSKVYFTDNNATTPIGGIYVVDRVNLTPQLVMRFKRGEELKRIWNIDNVPYAIVNTSKNTDILKDSLLIYRLSNNNIPILIGDITGADLNAGYVKSGNYLYLSAWITKPINPQGYTPVRLLLTNTACENDNIVPSFATFPTDINVNFKQMNVNTRPVSWTEPTTNDNCVYTTTAFTTPPPNNLTNGGNFPLGTTTVTYTARDARGNTAPNRSFRINVANPCWQDTEKPTITRCPNNIVDSTTAASLRVNFVTPQVSDNCGVLKTEFIPVSGSAFIVNSVTNVVFRVTDSTTNNFTECNFTVTIRRVVSKTFDIDPIVEEIKLSPNPTLGKAQLNVKSNDFTNLDIQILDVQGRQLQKEKFKVLKGDNIFELDLATLPKGVYIIQPSRQNIPLRPVKLIKL